MTRISRILWTFLVIDPLIIFSTVVCGTFSLLAVPFERDGKLSFKVARFWGRTLLVASTVRVRVEGLERIEPGKNYVFVSNHLSYMDTPVLIGSLPVDFRFLAKSGLFQIPFMGTYLKLGGHIPVPLEDARGGLRALMHAAQVIQEKRLSLLVFPEGGRSPSGELQEFVDGASYLAIKAGAPLVPIALIGTREVLPMGKAVFYSRPVTLRIGEPIPTEGLAVKDRAALTQQSRDRIVEMLQ